MRRHLKVLFRIFIILTTSITMIVFFSFFLYIIEEIKSYSLRFIMNGYETVEKTPIKGGAEIIDIKEYDRDDISQKSKSSLALFPERINEGAASMFFFYDPLFEKYPHSRVEIYLEWHTNKDNINQEKERIDAIIPFYNNKHPLWSKDLFVLTACIAAYNYDAVYEYALFDEISCVIRYVKLKNIGTLDDIIFSHDFEPKKILKNSDLRGLTHHNRYDIYTYP